MPLGFLTSPWRGKSSGDVHKDAAPAARQRSRAAVKVMLSQECSTKTKSVKPLPPTLGRANTFSSLPWAKPQCNSQKLQCRFVATTRKLGSGAYGVVLLGKESQTQHPVAMKFIPDGRMRQSNLDREVAMLRRLSEASHPALVRFYAHVKPAEAKAGKIRHEGTWPLPKPMSHCHALVMEVARGGELFDHVVGMDGLREHESGPLFGQLCDSVRAAHSLGIAHRDLKLENVLLVSEIETTRPALEGPQRIKLIDWGLAHQHALEEDGRVIPETLHSRCGSRSYMAPEVTMREISSGVGYDGFGADVWSLGVCLFAMHLAFFPFEQANPDQDWRAKEVLHAQGRGESTVATILSFYPQKPSGLSQSLITLIDSMLTFDPRRRATLEEVLHSEWLGPHMVSLRACGILEMTPALRLSTVSDASMSSSGSSRTVHDSDESAEPHLPVIRQESTASTARSVASSVTTDCSNSSLRNSAAHLTMPAECLAGPSRPPSPLSRPPSPLSMPPSPLSRPPSPLSRPPSFANVSRPPSPVAEVPRERLSTPQLSIDLEHHMPPPPRASARAATAYCGTVTNPPPVPVPVPFPTAAATAPTVDIVIAGGARAALAAQSLKAQSRRSSETLIDDEITSGVCSRSAYLATLFTKSCKVRRGTSPHQHRSEVYLAGEI